MDEKQLNGIALSLCISSGFRYIEVLNDMAKYYKDELDPLVYQDVTQAFAEYKRKMNEAGMKVEFEREL